MLWRMRTLYYHKAMKVCTVHNIIFPTIADISQTNKILVRSTLCCPLRFSHRGDDPARHMMAQIPLLVYLRKPTTIGACSGSPDIVSSPFQLQHAATSPRGSPARHRGLQTDIVRVHSGSHIYGYALRAQRVRIEQSHYVPTSTLILVSQHEHVGWDAQRWRTIAHSKGSTNGVPRTSLRPHSIAVLRSESRGPSVKTSPYEGFSINFCF